MFGGVAHLGERLNGIQEVVGSIPIVSTKQRKNRQNRRFFLYKFLFNYKDTIYYNQVTFAGIKKLYEKLFYLIKALCKPRRRADNFLVG